MMLPGIINAPFFAILRQREKVKDGWNFGNNIYPQNVQRAKDSSHILIFLVTVVTG